MAVSLGTLDLSIVCTNCPLFSLVDLDLMGEILSMRGTEYETPIGRSLGTIMSVSIQPATAINYHILIRAEGLRIRTGLLTLIEVWNARYFQIAFLKTGT